jgi:transposase
LFVGDVSISTHLKGNRPANWKGMIRYLKKDGFKILRIEEYHSSKLCCNCKKFNEDKVSNENWLKCRRTYGKQKGKMLPVFALYKCVCCGSIKQRDVNAVVNMYENGIEQLHGRTMNEFVIPDGVRENWLLNCRNYSHTAFKRINTVAIKNLSG